MNQDLEIKYTDYKQSVPEGTANDKIRDKAADLFTFLKELTSLRTRTIRTLDNYERILWFHEIPCEPECYSFLRDTPGEDRQEPWIEIKKPKPSVGPPLPPKDLEPWINLEEIKNSAIEIPPIRERIVVGIDQESKKEEIKELSDSPEIKLLWEKYIREQWSIWAEQEKRRAAIQESYTDFFSLYPKQQKLGEDYEVVLGLGLLLWKTQEGNLIKRHLITARASINFDASQGVVSVSPSPEGSKPKLEQDMLDPKQRPKAEELVKIEQHLSEIGENMRDIPQIQAILKSWIYSVSPYGQLDESMVPKEQTGENPVIYFAPAIILRKRTEKSILRVYEEILDQIKNKSSIPFGVERLVEITEDKLFSSNFAEDREKEATSSDLSEIFFPLPANDEQKKIAQMISQKQGVLVQGPPGTGKSHTIANLVCHLLANGERVLVTSHTKRALKVLRDKLPEKISALCVQLLGDDIHSMQSLQDSVHGITERLNSWDSDANARRIEKLTKHLDELRRREAEVLSDLCEIREKEMYVHSEKFGKYKGTAQQIALQIQQENPIYGWLSDTMNAEEDPPLSNSEAEKLLELMRNIPPEKEQELSKRFVDPQTLPKPEEFARLVGVVSNNRVKYEEGEKNHNHPAYSFLTGMDSDILNQLLLNLKEFQSNYEAVSNRSNEWVQSAVSQILSGQHRLWKEIRTETEENLESIRGDKCHSASETQISGLNIAYREEIKVKGGSLLQHLNSGGNLGFWIFRPKVVRDAYLFLKEIRVGGQVCENPHSLKLLLNWIEVTERLEKLNKIWSPFVKIFDGQILAEIAFYEDLRHELEKIFILYEKKESIRKILTLQLNWEPLWNNFHEIQRLIDVCRTVQEEIEFSKSRSTIQELESSLSKLLYEPQCHPVVQVLFNAVKEQDIHQYGKAYSELIELRSMREKRETRNSLFSRLKRLAPEAASHLTAAVTDSAWDKRMKDFSIAWNWARAKHWLESLSNPKHQVQLCDELEECRRKIREVLGDLVAELAWKNCFQKMGESERQHLVAWTKAMQRIGKGTGKYAADHREQARKHMEECRSAIPVWIMPIYRVAEIVRPGTDLFDVVIVDEASQSGAEALFLCYLARKMVVVGDDKQISPDNIGIPRDDVERLRQQYLQKIPHSDAFGADHSFFDLADIRYGGRIRLQEHFRCMPEIIQFSNNLCYSSEPLIPLRQYGMERLTPVVGTCHIPNGYQKGESPKTINPPEADAIVEHIVTCCKDPKYKGKAMGVISLLGEEQAKLIERKLLERLEPEEIEARNLICGDAYAFQGDERDVIFLSLVSAPTPGRRIGTLASEKDKRRFNVAVSRAKDQLWLFHTATLNDLSKECLRYKLLEYCKNPNVKPSSLEGIDIEELRIKSQTVDRSRVKPPSPFESWFEVDVFLEIARRGYRVIPQIEVAGYRIDLVVEGMQGRLAVECDGDYWHGREQYEHDMGRQRILERCGWSFFRVLGSNFYRNQKESLLDLWSKLGRFGIHPTTVKNENYAVEEEVVKKLN